MSSEGLKTRELVSREAQRTNEAIVLVDEKVNHLVIHQGAQINDHVCERFLKSLKYPDFNQRRNQIDSAHTDTLKWIFVGDDENESGEGHDSRSVSDTLSGTDSESGWSTVSSEASYLEDEDEDQGFFSKIKWDSFSNWLRSTDTIYWISGKPGSGKTTLVKYIVTHPWTRIYLDFWSPGCEIVSHYFWRPGSPMQKSLEGLFCSLLYQLLSNNDTTLGEVMSFVSGPKDSFTDWSSTELRSALSRALSSCKKGVCLFLDGIDEIDSEDGTKDGIPELLELVYELSQTRKIKICLASRPEPYILEMRLSMHPRLRLQELNYADLMAYAKDRVKYPQTKKSREYHDLAHSLVDRADGVFLWLLLAIKSINEGFSYYDNAKTLMERMERLPKGLHRLYEDMWRRAGADSPTEYRQTAALYFKLIIATQGAIRSSKHPFDTHEISVFDLTLATTFISGSLLDALNEPSKLISAEVLQQKCEEVEKKLKIYCMGLVEVSPETNNYREVFPALSWFGRTYDRTRRIATSKGLQFIHRTASDFLTDTESGRKILDHDMSSDYTLHFRLMEAKLASLVLFTYRKKMSEWCYQLQQIRARWHGTEEWVEKDWHRLILICEKLADSGRLFIGNRFSATPCSGINFLKTVALHNIDDEFIISRLKSGNLTTEEKSAILLNLSDLAYCPANLGNLESRFRTMLEFIREGADPNWQVSDKLHLYGWATLQTPWQHCLSSLLRQFNPTSSEYVTIPENFAFMARILVGFLSEGAELDGMVTMCLDWDEAKSRWYVMSNGWHGDSQIGIFASIPAYLIVGTLADTIPLYSQSYEESCLGSCVVLKQICANHSSSKLCRVLGKLGAESWPKEGEYVLWETTNEMKTELGDRLFESLKQQVLSTKCSDQQGMCKAVLNDESWFVRARGDESGLIKELEELELLEATDESPGIEEWVRKHIHETSRLGETT